jgi:hypothetical protein
MGEGGRDHSFGSSGPVVLLLHMHENWASVGAQGVRLCKGPDRTRAALLLCCFTQALHAGGFSLGDPA